MIDNGWLSLYLSFMVKVEIYIKVFCFYCVCVMKLFMLKGVELLDYDVIMGGLKKVEMVE